MCRYLAISSKAAKAKILGNIFTNMTIRLLVINGRVHL